MDSECLRWHIYHHIFITIYRLLQSHSIVILSWSWEMHRDAIVSRDTWWYACESVWLCRIMGNLELLMGEGGVRPSTVSRPIISPGPHVETNIHQPDCWSARLVENWVQPGRDLNWSFNKNSIKHHRLKKQFYIFKNFFIIIIKITSFSFLSAHAHVCNYLITLTLTLEKKKKEAL